MKNIFLKSVADEISGRIDSLQASSKPLWGKMNVAQMLTHCRLALEVASGRKDLPRTFLGYILGPFIKPTFYNDKPLPKNSPTADYFIVTDERVFNEERYILKRTVKDFNEGGETKCTSKPHAFFGKLTAEQWGMGMYKHLDHHLKQFGA